MFLNVLVMFNNQPLHCNKNYQQQKKQDHLPLGAGGGAFVVRQVCTIEIGPSPASLAA